MIKLDRNRTIEQPPELLAVGFEVRRSSDIGHEPASILLDNAHTVEKIRRRRRVTLVFKGQDQPRGMKFSRYCAKKQEQ